MRTSAKDILINKNRSFTRGYTTSIDKLPDFNRDPFKNIDEQTEYRNSIIKDTMFSIFMINEPNISFNESTTFKFGNFGSNVPDLKPLLYMLEELNSIRYDSASISKAKNAILECNNDIFYSVLGEGFNDDGDKFIDYLYKFFRESEEENTIDKRINSVIPFIENYTNTYNKCIREFNKFSNNIKDIDSSLLESVANFVGKYLKYSNIAFAVKSDSIRDCVCECYNIGNWITNDIYSVIEKEYITESYNPIIEDFVKDGSEIVKESKYKYIAENKFINSLLDDSMQFFNEAIPSLGSAATNTNSGGNEQPSDNNNNTQNNNDGTESGGGALSKITSFFKKIWEWITGLFKKNSDEFVANTTEKVNTNSNWLEGEKQNIINNAAASKGSIVLPNYTKGNERMTAALNANVKTSVDDAVQIYGRTSGSMTENGVTFEDKLRSEIISDYDPSKGVSFTKFAYDYFTGEDDRATYNINQLPVNDIIQSILDKNNINSISNLVKKDGAEIANNTQDVLKKLEEYKKENEELSKKLNRANALNKKKSAELKALKSSNKEADKNAKTGSVASPKVTKRGNATNVAKSGNATNVAKSGNATAGNKRSKAKSNKNTSESYSFSSDSTESIIEEIMNKYSSIRNISEATPNGQQTQTTEGSPSSEDNNQSPEIKKISDDIRQLQSTINFNDLRARGEYWKSVAQVKNEIDGSAMNAYDAYVSKFLKLFGMLRTGVYNKAIDDRNSEQKAQDTARYNPNNNNNQSQAQGQGNTSNNNTQDKANPNNNQNNQTNTQ